MVSIEKLSLLAPSGFSMSAEEQSGFAVSSLQRKQSEGLKESPKFWGRITGVTADYLIAVSYLPAYPFPIKKFYFCTTNDKTLAQMPDLTGEYTTLAGGMVSLPFQGEPGLVVTVPGKEDEPEPEPQIDENGEPIEPERFKEVHRLAYAVQMIERDVAIAPKGAYLVDASHQVVENKTYAGLSYEASGMLRSYFHLRPPTSARAMASLEKPGIVRATDFLDPIADDKPAGCWSLAFDPSNTVAILRSFYWPGYFFYSVVGSGDYGGVYVGNGKPNVDIQFML
jgi:hypothetical protein